MKKQSKRLKWFWFAATPLLLGLALALVTRQRAHRRVEAPLPDLHASSDPREIERGRYLVTGPAHCGECHGATTGPGQRRLDRPLSGGYAFDLPVGRFFVPNITPDVQTGIGRYSDPELARLLRYGIKPDGTLALPFMPYANLCDADLVAILSYLRTLPAEHHVVPEHDINVLGTFALAYLVEPKGPTEPLRENLTPEANAEYGRYLANDVGNCVMCHTKLDERTGAFAGPHFGGGGLHPSEANPEVVFVSPNLTPDPRWGWLEGWSEDTFFGRFRGGRVYEDSPMPWEAYQRLTETDLRAIYRYLKTLPPAVGGPDPQQREVHLAGR